MKRLFTLLAVCCIPFLLLGQEEERGVVSYRSSVNVYVKFASTAGIQIGDTLLMQKQNKWQAAMVVTNKSSISCVCVPFSDIGQIAVNDEVLFRKAPPPVVLPPQRDELPIEKPADQTQPVLDSAIAVTPEKIVEPEFKEKIRGRISAASYSNFSDSEENHRMRYAFSFRGHHLKNSRFSTDSYVTFRQTLGEWDRVRENLNEALKIYSLSVKYDFNESSGLTLGRRINPRISSMGAIDGLQYEQGLGAFKLGAIAGSRPDYSDYSINLHLMQAGVYLSHVSDPSKKYQQSTLGFIEQHNGSAVDRRFVYFQHSDNLLKKLNVFTSFEFDLYEKINNEQKNRLRLTNLYTSFRYRFTRNFSASASYDNRRNIIYYESYKNFIDQLIENETRQGLRLGLNWRPAKYVTWGINSSMRFQKDQGNTSRHANSYLTISRLPVIKTRATLSVNLLETGYLTSQVYGLRLSKNLLKNKVSTGAYLRWVHYDYKTSELTTDQKIIGLNCSLRLMKKLSFYVYYEGTYERDRPARTRVNGKLIQRF